MLHLKVTNMGRIEYIDKLKGLCILFMVMGHIMQISLGVNDVSFNSFYTSFHMPIFFFLSGLFVYKHFKSWNCSELWEFVSNKVKRLLLPFVTIGSIYVLYFDIDYVDLLTGGFNGYWFLPALFLCMLVDAFCSFLIRNIVKKNCTGRLLLPILLSFFILLGFYALSKAPYIRGSLYHYLFFAMGILVSQNYKIKKCIYASNWLYTISILVYISLWGRKFPYGFNFIAFASIIILTNTFYRYSSSIPLVLNKFGKYSLEIYVFHRFFLPSLSNLSEYLLNFQQFDKSENFLLFMLVSLCFSLPICYISVFVSKFIKHSNILRKVCFGK